MSRTICCYEYRFNRANGIEPDPVNKHRAFDCPGIIGRMGVDMTVEHDGIYIEFCPRREWLQKEEFAINFCGNGADVVVIHTETIPASKEEVANIARAALSDW